VFNALLSSINGKQELHNLFGFINTPNIYKNFRFDIATLKDCESLEGIFGGGLINGGKKI